MEVENGELFDWLEVVDSKKAKYPEFEKFIEQCLENGHKIEIDKNSDSIKRVVRVNGQKCFIHVSKTVWRPKNTTVEYYKFYVEFASQKEYAYQIFWVIDEDNVQYYIVPSKILQKFLKSKKAKRVMIYIPKSKGRRQKRGTIDFGKYLNNFAVFKPA
jgi:hypothetical protein